MEPEKKSNGALVGLVVIVIILITGGIYMWQVNKNSAGTGSQMESSAVTDQDSAQLNTLEQDADKIDTSTGVDVDTVN